VADDKPIHEKEFEARLSKNMSAQKARSLRQIRKLAKAEKERLSEAENHTHVRR